MAVCLSLSCIFHVDSVSSAKKWVFIIVLLPTVCPLPGPVVLPRTCRTKLIRSVRVSVHFMPDFKGTASNLLLLNGIIFSEGFQDKVYLAMKVLFYY